MLTYKDIDPTKKAFIFELDDVLFPKQDYLLQVYYLFANLIEYTEHKLNANELIEFFKESYIKEGEKDIFSKASEKFDIAKYEESFKSLQVNAKLPLKLLLYKEMLNLLTYIVGEGKSIFILTKGNPLIQLNKIKQIEWNGLDPFIKTYFYDEIILKSELKPIEYILLENNISPMEAIFFNLPNSKDLISKSSEVDYINAKLFLKKI